MRTSVPALVLCLALLVTTVASAYEEGETISLSVGSIPSGYRTYWVSSIDGYLGYGNPYSVSSLSVGKHTLNVYIYRTSDWVRVWSGQGTVTVTPKVTAPAPTPTPGTGSGSNLTYAPGEFEEVQTLLLGTGDAYMVDGLYSQFLAGIRGVVPTIIYVDNQFVRYDLTDTFNRRGVGNTDHTFRTTPVNSIWMRDYGPLYVKDQGQLEVVDLDYYPNRPQDDAIPKTFARDHNMTVRPLPVYWEGGNFTADGEGNLFASESLYTRNRQYSQSQVKSAVEDAFEGRLTILEPMLDDGGTEHIDMFFLMSGPGRGFVNTFRTNHQNYSRMERNAQKLRNLGITVDRIELADSRFSSHTNGLFVNDVAFVPTYGNSRTDAAAMAAYRARGYKAIGIDCREIITWAGALHCITITVPK